MMIGIADQFRPDQIVGEINKFVADQWFASLQLWPKEAPSFPLASGYPLQLVAIDEIVAELISSDAPLFSIDHALAPGHLQVQSSPLGKRLLWCLKLDLNAISLHFLKYSLSPYFELLRRTTQESPIRDLVLQPESVGHYNQWVQRFRAKGRSKHFFKESDNHNRTSRANIEGLAKKIRGLHKKNPTLLVVRMLLGRHFELLGVNESVTTIGDFNRSPKEAQRELGKLLRATKRKLPNLVWYSWRLEHSPTRSLYHQLLLFFNGPDVGDDAAPGRVVEDIWLKQFKHGSGVAINCNAQDVRFRLCGMTDLGITRRDDAQGRSNLERGALYLATMGAHAKLDVGIGKTYGSAQLTRRKRTKQRKPSLQKSNASPINQKLIDDLFSGAPPSEKPA